MCAECFIEGADNPEWREVSEDIDTRYKIHMEGEAERVFPVEFAPGLGNLGHEDLTTGESMGFDRAWDLLKNGLPYYGNCVGDFDDVNVLDYIIDNSIDTTYADLANNVSASDLAALEQELGYGEHLHIADDYAASFHKLPSLPLFYIDQSGIERVFAEPSTIERIEGLFE